MSNMREQLKATSLKTMKESDEKVSELVSTSRGEFLKIPKDKTTKYRIYPAHPGDNQFYQIKMVHWVPEMRERDNNGKKEVKKTNVPIFNARAHGGYDKDICEAYIEYAKKRIFEKYAKDQSTRDKELKKITGQDGPTGKINWVMYVDEFQANKKVFGRLEIPKTVKDGINNASVTEDANESISVDPFTDPDNGKAILITNKSDAEPSKMYTVNIEWKQNYKLTDEEIENFLKQEPLSKMYVNSYRQKDFERALKGLELFDKEAGFGFFGEDDWLDVVVAIKNELRLDPQAEEEEQEEEEEESGDGLNSLDRDGLKLFIKNRLPKDAVKIFQADTADSLRKKIRDYIAASGLEEEEEQEEEVSEEKGPLFNDKGELNEAQSQDRQNRLDSLQAKYAKRGKA